MKLTAGTTLQDGKYLVNHVLGQGGASMTLKGTLVPLNHGVILKTVPQDLTEQPDFSLIQQRFQEQVSRFARCQHPALVRLIDSFEEGGLPFAVMDYTSGETLKEWVETRGPLPEELAIHYIQQVGSALTAIHQHGLTHDHVSPDNIIRLPGSNVIVLVNYGLIEPAIEDTRGVNRASNPYTAIANLAQRSPGTDVYSLAATLYFVLTGRPPVAAALRPQTPLVPPRQLQPQLSAAVESAITSGLEVDNRLRPQSVATWLALLPTVEKRTWADLDIHVTPSSVAERKSNGSSKPPQPMVPPLPAPVSASLNGGVNGTPKQIQSTQATRPISPQPRVVTPAVHPPQPITRRVSSKGFLRFLLLISAIAAAVGLGAGILLRLAAGTTGPGSSLFHSEQAFPSLPEWPSSAPPVVPSTPYSPTPKPSITPARPSRQVATPIAPSPTPTTKNPSPSPSLDPTASPTAPLPDSSPPAGSTYSVPAPSPSVELPTRKPAPEPVLPPPAEALPPATPAPQPEGNSTVVPTSP